MVLELAIVAAISSSRSYSAPRSYSSPKTYSTPKSTPKSSTSKPSGTVVRPKPATVGGRVGKAPLRSSTPAPKPHSFKGTTYNSSTAPYTNNHGLWVFFWVWFVTKDNNKEIRCFDEDHKRVTCNRDDKAYSRDW